MTLNKNYDAILFDLDGTLWDTIESCMQSLEYVKNKYPDITKKITSEQVKSAMGKSFSEIVQIYYGYLPKEKAVSYAKEAFNKNVENLLENGGILYPNTKGTILELSKKYKLYIVSNCVNGYIESFLNTSGLAKCFKDYECNGKTGLSKGENINLIIERNALKNAIYVGDTISDKEAANFANIPFIYSSYGFGNVDKYNYKIDDISDLIKILIKESQ